MPITVTDADEGISRTVSKFRRNFLDISNAEKSTRKKSCGSWHAVSHNAINSSGETSPPTSSATACLIFMLLFENKIRQDKLDLIVGDKLPR